jgi:hypothetical protein
MMPIMTDDLSPPTEDAPVSVHPRRPPPDDVTRPCGHADLLDRMAMLGAARIEFNA